MMKRIALVLGVILSVAVFFQPLHSPPIESKSAPADEEPSLAKPPEVATSTKEAKPEIIEKEPEAPNLPEGVICTDDCPLIDPAIVEEKVREFFADIPVMVAVAKCESRFRQYDTNGEALKNREGSSATGVLQIMASYHREIATNLGYDIDTLEGNLGYARHLYESNGTRDWEASRTCWGSSIVAKNKDISES
jgi:hypothetical protein